MRSASPAPWVDSDFKRPVDLWIKTTSTRRETIMSDRLTCTVTSPANAASWELQVQPNGTASFAVAGPDAGAGTTFVSAGVATTQRINDGQWHRHRRGAQWHGTTALSRWPARRLLELMSTARRS
jgi:hypothetical protein